jgi:hypothetical protein
MAEELMSIYRQAGKLSNDLQTQLTDLEVQDQATMVGQAFSARVGTMEAHRIHRLIDDDDISADGREVSLVLNPVVRISGNDDGEGYGRNFRILVKACVVLGCRSG